MQLLGIKVHASRKELVALARGLQVPLEVIPSSMRSFTISPSIKEENPSQASTTIDISIINMENSAKRKLLTWLLDAKFLSHVLNSK